MSSYRTTLLTNVYNEEYLLPFWLQHHKDMFDDIIIVDYGCTDKSLEICKTICPNCKIIPTRNSYFDSDEIDKEFMDLEKDIEGINADRTDGHSYSHVSNSASGMEIKIILNTTEFLFCEKSIKSVFSGDINQSYFIKVLSPYSKKQYDDIKNNNELLSNLLNDDIVFHYDRPGGRVIHNNLHGNYHVGRHFTNNPYIETNEMYIVWFGFYPLNEKLLNRKLQIQNKMPQSDKDRGAGFQHLFTKNKMLSLNDEKAETGLPLKTICVSLFNLLHSKYKNKTFIVTGGCGFIGSHMVDKLIMFGYNVIVIDNLLSGSIENLNKNAIFENVDICDFELLNNTVSKYNNIDGIFHFAALARTPWCIDDPLLCYKTNVIGTLNILEVGRKKNIKRIVLSSSNVVYAFFTPYRTSKEALEGLAITYNKMYNMSVIALRYSNVYGKRQSENGPSPNVFAALRKSKKEIGKLIITGDGTQTRNYTHVSDIVSGNLLAMFNEYCGVIDLCTGISIPLNEAAKYFNCPIEYINEREGDIKHIIQSPVEAYKILGWKAFVKLEDGINDVLL